MKQYCHTIIENRYLGGEILHSNAKCKNEIYKVLFAGAEQIGYQWKVNFILTFICPANTQGCGCQGSSSANMYVIAKPKQNIRFEPYLGIIKKETIEQSPENYEFYDRFFPVHSIKLLKIETDYIQYEICFI